MNEEAITKKKGANLNVAVNKQKKIIKSFLHSKETVLAFLRVAQQAGHPKQNKKCVCEAVKEDEAGREDFFSSAE